MWSPLLDAPREVQGRRDGLLIVVAHWPFWEQDQVCVSQTGALKER